MKLPAGTRVYRPRWRDGVRAAYRWLRGRYVKGPCCRRCAYPAKGLSQPRCPECGADLSESGVVDPHVDIRQSIGAVWQFTWQIGVLSVPILLVGMFLGQLLLWYGVPHEFGRYEQIEFTSLTGDYTVHIRGRGWTYGMAWQSPQLSLKQLKCVLEPVPSSVIAGAALCRCA